MPNKALGAGGGGRYSRGQKRSFTLCVYTQNVQNFMQNSNMHEKHETHPNSLRPFGNPPPPPPGPGGGVLQFCFNIHALK